MRIFGPKSILTGACLLIHIKAPLVVRAEPAEISIPELDAFIQTNAASIVHFQNTMRDVSLLWDASRTIGKKPNTPLTLDTLRGDLENKVNELSNVAQGDPLAAPQTLKALGFANHTIPEKNGFDWDDEPPHRADPLAQSCRRSRERECMVAPKLFGGSIYKYRGIFIYDKGKRAYNSRQLNIYFSVFDTGVHDMQNLLTKTFRVGPKFGIAVEIKELMEDIIKIAAGFREGVKRARDAYIAVPPLPGSVEDENIKDDIDENVGVSQVPRTLQKKILASPEYIEAGPGSGTEILNIPEFQFEASGELQTPESASSKYGLLQSLPAYVETDFDLLSAPACSLEEEMAAMRNPQGQHRCTMLSPKWMTQSCPSLVQDLLIHPPVHIKPVNILTEDIDYFALQIARKPLEKFAHATDYAERLYRKIYPYKPNDKDIHPSEIVDGVRNVDITFEYLLRGFHSRLFRAGKLVRQIQENREPPDEGAGQADIHTYGFRNNAQAVQLLPGLEALYERIAAEKHRVPGIHRWIRTDLTNGDLKGWESDLIAVAWSVIGARVDFDPDFIVYDPPQQELWKACLDETEWRLKGIKVSIDQMRVIFAKNSPRLAKTTSFDFNFDFEIHLKRLSDWHEGWHNAVSMLYESYSEIPHYSPRSDDLDKQFKKESFSTYPMEPEFEVSETEVICPDETGVRPVPQVFGPCVLAVVSR
ncbi:hypothetical protein TWF132_005969 [Orbilia oligospora]|nr:hypothetical protein TWF132_005969 [Orbilia oligospora]